MSDMTDMQVSLAIGDAQGRRDRERDRSWFEAMADAWGTALDAQAGRIETRADLLNDGDESPSQITMLTAESLRMQFLSNSSHTALTSMGSALETMARKQ